MDPAKSHGGQHAIHRAYALRVDRIHLGLVQIIVFQHFISSFNFIIILQISSFNFCVKEYFFFLWYQSLNPVMIALKSMQDGRKRFDFLLRCFFLRKMKKIRYFY